MAKDDVPQSQPTLDEEIEAIRVVLHALASFDDATRERVLDYARGFFGLNPGDVPRRR